MNIHLDGALAKGYKSPSQIARRVTEAWAEENLYCVACSSSRVAQADTNAEAIDFRCDSCSSAYQLKALKSWSDRRVPDAGYDAMMRALRSDSVPNLLVMHYSLDWIVHRLMVIPSFLFTPAAIQKRKPLHHAARRAGWVGCNILLSEIADDGKIFMLTDAQPVSQNIVRSKYDLLRPFAELDVRLRGWTLDVFRMVRRINKDRFSLDDVYAFEGALGRIHPENKNVRPKIRQQLQVLRDLGFVHFHGKGQYSLISQLDS